MVLAGYLLIYNLGQINVDCKNTPELKGSQIKLDGNSLQVQSEHILSSSK